MLRGRADFRGHGAADRCRRQSAGCALRGHATRVAVWRNGFDVFADGCLSFGALAEADLTRNAA